MLTIDSLPRYIIRRCKRQSDDSLYRTVHQCQFNQRSSHHFPMQVQIRLRSGIHILQRNCAAVHTRSHYTMLVVVVVASRKPLFLVSFLIISAAALFSCCFASTFTVTNNCPFTIWPATLSGSGAPPLPTTGFQLDSGESVKIPSAAGWSGRIWARTGCSFDASGVGSCQTGDCQGKLECGGMGATPPASLFEITLGQGDVKDFYDVSIVDGYNLPMVAAPQGVLGGCNATGCLSNLNMGCPKELQVYGGDGDGEVVGCKSACEAFGLAQYCCSGEFANPSTCKPSFYSTIFKRACPRAYSYAFDDGTSTFTCKASQYAIVFCPTGAIRSPPGAETANQKYVMTTDYSQVSSSTTTAQLHPFLTLVLIIFLTLFSANNIISIAC